MNEVCLAEVDARGPCELADAVTRELSDLVGLLGAIGAETAGSTVVRLHAGLKSNAVSGLSYVLFDFLAHGHDIATAAGRAWLVEPRHAALDLHAALPIFEPWVQRSVLEGPAQQAAISFPGDPAAIVLDVGDGRYHAQNQPRSDAPADLTEVDPVEAFLALARRGPATTPAVQRLVSWFEPI